MNARLSPPTLLQDQKPPKKLRWTFFLDRHLKRSRCPFVMFGPVVSGKYHRPDFFLFVFLEEAPCLSNLVSNFNVIKN